MLRRENDRTPVGGRLSRMISIYAYGMHGRFRLGYGAQHIHVAAAMAEDRAVIDDMVAHGADPDARDAGGCAPLHYAASSNPVGAVARALFEAGADPEACDGNGSKPLDYAITAANTAFIDAALDAGADPAGSGDAFEDARDMARRSRDAPGWTPEAAVAESRACRRLMQAARKRFRLVED